MTDIKKWVKVGVLDLFLKKYLLAQNGVNGLFWGQKLTFFGSILKICSLGFF